MSASADAIERPHARHVGGRGEASQRRCGGGRNGNAEQPDGQVHDPKCVVEPRHRTRSFTRGELCVHEHVDLCGGHSHSTRAHQQQHTAKRGVADVEPWPIRKPFSPEGPPLNEELSQPPNQRRDGHKNDGLESEAWRQRDARRDDHDRRHVEHGRRQGWNEKMAQRVQHAHEHGRHGHQRQERSHDARQQYREFKLAGDIREVRRKQPHQRFGEDDGYSDEQAGYEDEHGDDRVGQRPPPGLATDGQLVREGGDECRAHGPLGEQVTRQVGHPERHPKRIHGVIGTEVEGQNLVADQSQDTTGHGRQTEQSGRTRQAWSGFRMQGVPQRSTALWSEK